VLGKARGQVIRNEEREGLYKGGLATNRARVRKDNERKGRTVRNMNLTLGGARVKGGIAYIENKDHTDQHWKTILGEKKSGKLRRSKKQREKGMKRRIG